MAGSSVLTLPWAYLQSGLVLGFTITTVGFVVSLWTCLLCISVTDPRGDFFDAVRVYMGPCNQGLAILSFLMICESAIIAQFMVSSQMMYPTLLAFVHLCSGVDLPQVPANDFT